MKLQRTFIVFLTAALLAITPLSLMAGKGGGKAPGKNKPPTVTMQLSADAEADLLFMREEEKLARDVYDEMYDNYAKAIFDNISNAEQKHMDALKKLVDKYGLADPVTDGRGVFGNTHLAVLYDALVAEGEDSLTAAVYVGARIEELDIMDLQEAIGNTERSDIVMTYENLMKGSRNHLRAFVRQWESITAELYTAQLMPQDEVDAIVNSPMERGRAR